MCNGMNEVRFDIYCPLCSHFAEKDNRESCLPCMNEPYNKQSNKPICFKEKELRHGTLEF